MLLKFSELINTDDSIQSTVIIQNVIQIPTVKGIPRCKAFNLVLQIKVSKRSNLMIFFQEVKLGQFAISKTD